MSGLRPVLLVGLDNPQSTDPKYALHPLPKNCSGYNLHQMIRLVLPEFGLSAYARIPRTNLFPVGKCPGRPALKMAGQLLRAQLNGHDRYVVLLGNDVRDAVLGEIDKVPDEPCTWAYVDKAWYAWIPHPSGLNKFYNNKANRLKIGRFLGDIV